MANTEFNATVSLKEGLFVEAETRGFTVHMDEPEHLGGTDKAMNPVELLLSSLGGCLTISIAAFSKAVHVDLKDVRVNVSGDIDLDGFLGVNKNVRPGFNQIRYDIELVSDSSEVKLNKLINMVKERCPVSDTLKGVEVNGDFNIKVAKE